MITLVHRKLRNVRKRKETLNIVSTYIKNYFNLSKYNFYDDSKEDFVEPKSVIEIVTDLGLSEETCYSALEISEICFVDNYFKVDLQAWDANMDIPPAFSKCKQYFMHKDPVVSVQYKKLYITA